MAREAIKNGEGRRTSMPFSKHAAHQFDQPDGPATDPLGRANPNRSQMEQLAQTLKAFRKRVLEGEHSRQPTDGPAEERQGEFADTGPEGLGITPQLKKKGKSRREHPDRRDRGPRSFQGNGNGERQRGPVPGAFGGGR